MIAIYSIDILFVNDIRRKISSLHDRKIKSEGDITNIMFFSYIDYKSIDIGF